MKIYVVPPYYDWEYDKLTDYKYCITFEDDYDLEIISKLIKEGDIIRIIHYNSPRIVVQNVNFIELPKKLIEIRGIKYYMAVETIVIGINMQIEIDIKDENIDRINKLNKMIEFNHKFEMYKKAISSEQIQNEGFRILHQYINRRPYKVIYGNDVISSMKNELVKVIFVCWNFIKLQDERMINILTQDNHKYNNTNIVVIWKGNENYEELKTYGGIVGVLL